MNEVHINNVTGTHVTGNVVNVEISTTVKNFTQKLESIIKDDKLTPVEKTFVQKLLSFINDNRITAISTIFSQALQIASELGLSLQILKTIFK